MGALAGVPSVTDVDHSPQHEDGAGQGDPHSSMELLYRLHRAPLYRFLMHVTLGDRRDAEDLLQETLCRAWRHLQDHRLDVERLLPWLYTVARRIAIDAARARRARPTEQVTADLSILPAPYDDIEQMLVTLTLHRGLMSLTEEHRQVLMEVFYNERTAGKAAEVLGIPEGTVRSRTFYAIRALRAVTRGIA